MSITMGVPVYQTHRSAARMKGVVSWRPSASHQSHIIPECREVWDDKLLLTMCSGNVRFCLGRSPCLSLVCQTLN